MSKQKTTNLVIYSLLVCLLICFPQESQQQLASVPVTEALVAQNTLSNIVGVDPQILKQLPIQRQLPGPSRLNGVMLGGASNKTKISQSKDMIFVSNTDSTGFSAYFKSTGKVAWPPALYSNVGYKGVLNTIASSPCYDPVNDLVYFVAPDQKFYALSAKDGTPAWSINRLRLDSYMYTPVTANGAVSIITYNNETNSTQFQGFSGVGIMQYNITIQPQVSKLVSYGNSAFFTQYPYSPAIGAKQNTSQLLVIDIKSGIVQRNISLDFTATSLPFYVSDLEIYMGAANGTSNKLLKKLSLGALNAFKTEWTVDLSPLGAKPNSGVYPAINSLQAISNDTLYVPTLYGELYALDRLTGYSKWNISKINMTQTADSAPLLIEQNLVIGSNKGYVYVVNTNLTTVSYIQDNLKDVLNIVLDSDNHTVYYADSAGIISSIFVDYDTDYVNIFRQNHPYFDMGAVKFSYSNYSKADPLIFSSDQIFDQFWNDTYQPIGFSKLQSIKNMNSSTEEVMFGSLGYKLFNLANISSYAHYTKFNRSTKASIVSSVQVNQANQSTYVGSLDNVVYGVGIDNKQFFTLNTFGPILTQPILLNKTLYVTSSDGYVYAIDPYTSRQENITVFYKAFAGNWTVSCPFFVGTSMYFGMTDGQISALDTVQQVVVPLAKMKNRIFADGAFDMDGYLYFADVGGNVAKYDRAGKVQWSTLLDGAVYGGISVVNTTVAVPTMAGSFYFLDTKTGTVNITRQFKNLGSMMTSPVNYNETFYIGSLDGWVYAFNSTDNTILNAQQLDNSNNITSLSTTENFVVDRLLYIVTSRLDPVIGGFSVNNTVNSTIFAVTPPGATKKYTPIDNVGPIILQPDYTQISNQIYQGPPLAGLDSIPVPQFQNVVPQNTYLMQTSFSAAKCIECTYTLGHDVGRWVMGVLYDQGKIDSQYLNTQCPASSNKCSHRRKMLQQSFKVPMTLTFGVASGDVDSVKKILQQQSNNVSASQILKDQYGAQNFELTDIQVAPQQTTWKKNQKYFIVLIVVFGVVILTIVLLCIQAKCRKPNQRRFRNMLKNVGPLGPVTLQGNKIQQNKPLLNADESSDGRVNRHQRGAPTSDTLNDDELEDIQEEPHSRSTLSKQKSKLSMGKQYSQLENDPPSYNKV